MTNFEILMQHFCLLLQQVVFCLLFLCHVEDLLLLCHSASFLWWHFVSAGADIFHLVNFTKIVMYSVVKRCYLLLSLILSRAHNRLIMSSWFCRRTHLASTMHHHLHSFILKINSKIFLCSNAHTSI